MIEFEYTGKNAPIRMRFGKLQIDNGYLESIECRVRQDGGYSATGDPYYKGWHEGQVETLQALLRLRGKKVVSLDPEFIEIMYGLLKHHGYHNEEEEEYLCGRLGGVQDVLESLNNICKYLMIR